MRPSDYMLAFTSPAHNNAPGSSRPSSIGRLLKRIETKDGSFFELGDALKK